MSNEFPFQTWAIVGGKEFLYAEHRTREAAETRIAAATIFPTRTFEIREAHEQRTNIDDALEIVAEIDRVRSVIRELKAAFAKSELDGGAKAAPSHPLYIQAQAKLDELHDQLMQVI
ncbi:hypothetical protein SEA_SADLAD_15 [Microbacterium phage SadLad]|nr:hypothetical protein SEA_SADLAD_15 [Microbacterium phage SadLad]